MNAHLIFEDGTRIPAEVDLSSISIDFADEVGDESVITRWDGLGATYDFTLKVMNRSVLNSWLRLTSSSYAAGFRVVNHRGRRKLVRFR